MSTKSKPKLNDATQNMSVLLFLDSAHKPSTTGWRLVKIGQCLMVPPMVTCAQIDKSSQIKMWELHHHCQRNVQSQVTQVTTTEEWLAVNVLLQSVDVPGCEAVMLFMVHLPS